MYFEIKDLPKLPNTLLRRHWSVVSRESNKWHRLVKEKVIWPNPPLQKAKLIFTRFSVKEPDFDNLVSSFKWVMDALVECGVIIDDKYSNVVGSEYRWQKVAKKEQQGIRVQLEA